MNTIDEQHEEERDDSILRDEVVNAIYSLKHGKAAGVDNIPRTNNIYEGMTDILHKNILGNWYLARNMDKIVNYNSTEKR